MIKEKYHLEERKSFKVVLNRIAELYLGQVSNVSSLVSLTVFIMLSSFVFESAMIKSFGELVVEYILSLIGLIVCVFIATAILQKLGFKINVNKKEEFEKGVIIKQKYDSLYIVITILLFTLPGLFVPMETEFNLIVGAIIYIYAMLPLAVIFTLKAFLVLYPIIFIIRMIL